MKVIKMVDVDIRIDDSRSLRLQDEIELNITPDEVVAAILEPAEGDDGRRVMRLINNVGIALRAFPDQVIETQLNPEVRRFIANFLKEQLARFAPPEA